MLHQIFTLSEKIPDAESVFSLSKQNLMRSMIQVWKHAGLFVDGDWEGHNNKRVHQRRQSQGWTGLDMQRRESGSAEDGNGSRSKIVSPKHRFMHVMKDDKQRVGVTEWEKVGRSSAHPLKRKKTERFMWRNPHSGSLALFFYLSVSAQINDRLQIVLWSETVHPSQWTNHLHTSPKRDRSHFMDHPHHWCCAKEYVGPF